MEKTITDKGLRSFIAQVDHAAVTDSLHAAAPDLLAALQDVLRYCVTPAGVPHKGRGRTGEQQKALDAARAAIAKAEGRD